ncbi:MULTISPECIES: DUF3967 domain-containing protein [unclassified Bacillus (in: firmicutes)]|uniref:DUF3967 domain-containing protein n=1 Tax=unclassified Bacillus (in: firmicutes) TaxID=185979 RepID=UPI000BF18832|nr:MULTISPECIES: DUF3967 domain-containing protein [unclassified Bacillus (in: firmicutes)]PEJ60407.1 hypothetical protein CN692_03710 [Bacillus sp. AFS002410]PEL10582.1 hypothetical protein CN601_12585 [Bacillus sp. AFS017336]
MSVIFTSKDISKKLKIGKSRVREISKELEKNAYQFTKNQDTRIYNQSDFELFQLIVKDYQKDENLSQAVQSALNNLLNQSLAETIAEVAITSENEITLNNDEQITSNAPQTPLEDNIHNDFDIKNKNEIIEEENENLDEVVVIQNETELISHLQEETLLVENGAERELIEEVIIEETVVEQELMETPLEVQPTLIEKKPIEANVSREVTFEGIPDKQSIEEIDQMNEAPTLSQLDEVVKEYHFEEMTVEQILEENNKLPDEDIPTNLNESKIVIDQIVSKEKVTTFVPTNTNQIMFEEFMSQITNLAFQNEQILTQNQTLIKQNLEKDQKLEQILISVEEKSEELHELAAVIEEKDEKLEQIFEEIQSKESGRDAQLMRMIRELQETKKMVAASKERDWKNAIKSLFFKPKSVK